MQPFSPPRSMNHEYIVELNLVQRYLTGRLAADETAAFEEHFVDCLECVGQLETTKGLIEGLRIVASNPETEPSGYEPKAPFLWWRPTNSRWPFALGAALFLILALVGAVVLYDQVRHLRREADGARRALAESELRFDAERQSSSLAEMRHQSSERELENQLVQLQSELENQQKMNSGKMAADPGALKNPQINLAIFVLRSTRGSDPSTGSLNELNISRIPTNFVVSIPLEGEESHKTYRITILDDHSRRIWRGSGLKPDRYNSLLIGFNSTFFNSGDYLLIVEGIEGNGTPVVVGKYSFRVVKNP